jgi:putative endonuclease
MNFDYILQSASHPDQFYTGLCADVQTRLRAHNAGKSLHTAKFKPWKLISFHYFERSETAVAFERYLKTGSGRAFALRHFR